MTSDESIRSVSTFYMDDIPKSPETQNFNIWLQSLNKRSLSLPDIHKMQQEWVKYQNSDESITTEPTHGAKLQVDLLNIRLDSDIKKPQMRLKMGASQYYSKRGSNPHGDWNEGFVFYVSYHAQLFNIIEFDLYDKPYKHWPRTTKHVGKAKLKISTLGNRDDVFVTFLPIYEYHSHRLLPSEIQTALVEADVLKPRSFSRKGDRRLIGSIQIRVRYHFQNPHTDKEISYLKPLFPLSDESLDENVQHRIAEEIEKERSIDEGQTQPPDNLAPSDTNYSHVSSHGRGDLVQDEGYVDDVFHENLTKIMSQHIPVSRDQSLQSLYKKENYQRSSSSDNKSVTSLDSSSKGIHWLYNLITPSKMLPASASGKKYGFSQNDNEEHHDDSSSETASGTSSHHNEPASKHRKRKKAQQIIDGSAFGDKNFASQWMHETYDDIAISHPLVDKLIGMVVSKQTQAMLRAIIKTANSFGQGFRVTGAKLLGSSMLVQKYYESLPRPQLNDAIEDKELIDYACHYYAYALVTYGWRGLLYLGAYGHYVRGGRDRHSNRLAIIRYLNIDPEDLLGYEYALRKGASLQPSYFVARDRSHDAIVLSIRGTWSLYDAITDLVCEYMPWKGGMVHSGMLASAQWFYTNIIPQIFRYIHHHGGTIKRFIITGHSLGGGTASLLTMMVADHIDELRRLASNPSFDLHCFNYAPAAVSSLDLAKKYDEFIHSFVCQDDIVGKMSYGSAMKLKEMILETVSAYNTLGGWRKVMTDTKARKAYFKILDKRREYLNSISNSTYPSLYIPGKIVLIKRTREAKFTHEKNHKENIPVSDSMSEDTSHHGASKVEAVSKHIPGARKFTFSLHYAPRSLSGEIVLTKTCIEDHMIDSYQDAFDALNEEISSP